MSNQQIEFLPAIETEIRLKRVQSFFVGGYKVELTDLPRTEITTVPGIPPRMSDPNGHYQVGQMYGQFYELNQPACETPLLFWHGGGMTGATWGDTPDGRGGWHDYFMRRGFNTCITDAVERGRSSWAPYPTIFEQAPEHRTIDQAWSIFRFGPADGYKKCESYPGQRFPTTHADELAKQFVARWSSNQDLVVNAYGALLSKFNRSVIIAHSEGARYAQQAAALFPEHIAAVVLLEPASCPVIEDSYAAQAANVPHLVVWGDYFEESELWKGYRRATDAWFSKIEAAGGSVSTLDLPSQGIYGNSHMLMMDSNSDVIAGRVAQWLMANVPLK